MVNQSEAAEGRIEGIDEDSILVRVILNDSTRMTFRKKMKVKSLVRVVLLPERGNGKSDHLQAPVRRRRSSFDAKKLLSRVKGGRKGGLVDFGPAIGKELD
jgi:hypothetical protein